MTLEQALESRKEAQKRFEQALKDKINSLKFAYSKADLNEKQVKFLQRDEELCRASEELVNKLIAHVNFLIHENKQQQAFMSDIMRDVNKWQEQYINISLELNDLRFEKMREAGELKFSFEKELSNG